MYGYGLAWPINHLVPYLHYVRFVWTHWDEYCTKDEEISERINETFIALSTRLGETDSFYQSGYFTPYKDCIYNFQLQFCNQ